jgi:hypothetical protein
MNLTTKYDVFAAAVELVENQLGVLEALSEAQKYRMDVRSRLVCRCPSCQGETNSTLAWLERIREPEAAAESA